MAGEKQLSDGRGDGFKLGQTSTDKVAFYGTTPISQRASSWQATSVIGTASSADVTTDLKATVIEIMNTLNNLGVWKGGA